jgi:DNA-binding CsgD family transcriptional regulator
MSSQEAKTEPAPQGHRPVRRRQRRLRLHEIEALVAAYRGGMTMNDLARTFGVHRLTVSAHLRQHAVPIRRRGLDQKDVPEAARLYEAGWSSLRLGEKFGVSPDTVLAALRRARVRIRPGKGGPSKRHP